MGRSPSNTHSCILRRVHRRHRRLAICIGAWSHTAPSRRRRHHVSWRIWHAVRLMAWRWMLPGLRLRWHPVAWLPIRWRLRRIALVASTLACGSHRGLRNGHHRENASQSASRSLLMCPIRTRKGCACQQRFNRTVLSIRRLKTGRSSRRCRSATGKTRWKFLG